MAVFAYSVFGIRNCFHVTDESAMGNGCFQIFLKFRLCHVIDKCMLMRHSLLKFLDEFILDVLLLLGVLHQLEQPVSLCLGLFGLCLNLHQLFLEFHLVSTTLRNNC